MAVVTGKGGHTAYTLIKHHFHPVGLICSQFQPCLFYVFALNSIRVCFPSTHKQETHIQRYDRQEVYILTTNLQTIIKAISALSE
jgi:hypothetical protein